MKKEAQSGKRKKLQKKPYLEALLAMLGVEGDISEDQLQGLRYAINKLNPREKDVLVARYDNRITYREVAASLHIPLDRARYLHDRAIKKLKQHEAYYRDGFTSTVHRLAQEKEDYKTELVEKVKQADQNHIAQKSVKDVELSARIINSLTGAGIYTVGDLVTLILGDPVKFKRIKNIGVKSREEIMQQLTINGVVFSEQMK